MKVLQVTPRYPPHTGGVETHVKEISERLVERGHEVVVHAADAGGDVRSRETRNGVVVRRHRAVAPDGAFHVAPGIAAAVRRARADVVHAHNYHSLPLALAALGVGDARFVVTPHYHGASADPVRDRLLSLYRPVGRRALRRADDVVAVSEWERDRLRDDFGVEATVIPNGVDVERFRNAEPVRRDRPYLLTVGRLEEYKGVQYVVRALQKLDYELVVAGEGPFRDDLERIAHENGVSEQVDFHGYVSDDDLASLFAGAEAYVTMSEHEAYGMTVAEALAAETPCVVRETGALVDWTGEDGCVGVTTTDPDAIASAVRGAVRTTPSVDIPTWDTACESTLRLYRATSAADVPCS